MLSPGDRLTMLALGVRVGRLTDAAPEEVARALLPWLEGIEEAAATLHRQMLSGLDPDDVAELIQLGQRPSE